MKKSILFLSIALLLSACGADVEKYEDGLYENGTFYFYGGETATGTLDQGNRAGEWTFYDKNKNLAAKGKYADGKETGPWKFWYDNGKMQKEGAFNEGISHGPWKTYFTDETLESEGDYKNGKRMGIWQHFHDNTQRRSMGSMEDDLRVGKWEFWYNNGEPQEVRVYKGKYNVLQQSWGENGQLMVVDGTGPYEYWEFGLLRERGTYKEGKMNGKWIFWDENGTVTQEGYFEGGKKVSELAPEK